MNKIIIHPSKSADTRSADHMITEEELKKSTVSHISDVRKGMDLLAKILELKGEQHDWTKLFYLEDFFKQFNNAQKTGDWGTGWYDQIHVVQERHHFNDRVPENVDLLDVLEQIVDCVMAGLARNGEYRKEPLPEGLLQKAYDNTIEKLLKCVEVQGD